jgi:hypothetical protein
MEPLHSISLVRLLCHRAISYGPYLSNMLSSVRSNLNQTRGLPLLFLIQQYENIFLSVSKDRESTKPF